MEYIGIIQAGIHTYYQRLLVSVENVALNRWLCCIRCPEANCFRKSKDAVLHNSVAGLAKIKHTAVFYSPAEDEAAVLESVAIRGTQAHSTPVACLWRIRPAIGVAAVVIPQRSENDAIGRAAHGFDPPTASPLPVWHLP